ncbi:MAG: polyphenol oxidase family protein [Candidatus Gottesmanbacteria bacterium]|nr:polyphenol oxidase family protein [Candidatus Gottesmanbacteria bacterium]
MIRSTLLINLGIVHGYSTRTESREKFLEILGVRPENLVVGQQVHGTQIAVVKAGDKGKILTGIDGLVSKYCPISLGVTFADCVPILAVDPKAKIIGTAHAGWKGTLAGIAGELILVMKNAGADVNNIYVSIGPHIGMCCYNVHKDRAMTFQKQFGYNEKITARIQGAWHLDIGFANYQTLLETGIPKDNIDTSVTCTSCQISEFNSFRKDPKDKFGVQLGVIAV